MLFFITVVKVAHSIVSFIPDSIKISTNRIGTIEIRHPKEPNYKKCEGNVCFSSSKYLQTTTRVVGFPEYNQTTIFTEVQQDRGQRGPLLVKLIRQH